MLFVFDSEEIKHRQKLQQFGNMSLLVELYVQGHIPEKIIEMCVQTLLEDLNDQRTEILCQMLHKIASHVVKRAQQELTQGNSSSPDKKKKPLQLCLINLDFIERVFQRLFPWRHAPELSSRVRFKVQDLIDEYHREWKKVIYGERKVIDEEGFQCKYVPKVAAKAHEVVIATAGGKKSRKTSNVSEGKAYIYVPKTEVAKQALQQQSLMQALFDGLSPAMTVPEERRES
jgi:hypothetical protein